jgi:hypothetical protein
MLRLRSLWTGICAGKMDEKFSVSFAGLVVGIAEIRIPVITKQGPAWKEIMDFMIQITQHRQYQVSPSFPFMSFSHSIVCVFFFYLFLLSDFRVDISVLERFVCRTQHTTDKGNPSLSSSNMHVDDQAQEVFSPYFLKVAEILIRNMSMPGDLSGKTKSGIKQ